MKALMLKEYNRFEFTDMEEPVIGPEEVLIRVRACGICGSDVHGMDGSTGRRHPPLVMGHEASGEIAQVGSDVAGWTVGDRVTFDSTVYCGTCSFCRAGRFNLCDNRRVLGVSCEEYRRHGAFAEYVAAPQHILYRLPDGLPYEHAAMVEALSIAFHAVRRAEVSLNDSAVVIGSGMIGLLLIQTLGLAGCGRIIAVDVDERRLELARTMGADAVVRPDRADVPTEIAGLTGGRGADLAFEAVGISETVQAAVRCVRKGGQVTLVGNLSPNVTLPLQAAVTRELTLRGSCASCGEYPACLEMMARGAIDVAPLISKVAPLSEGAQWFERLHDGGDGLMKVILVP